MDEVPRPLRNNGPWTVRASRDVYQDPWMRVRRDEVIRPDGQPGSYGVVHLKPGVCVVALDGQANVHLTEEFHYGVERDTIEGVSGGIDPGEDALDAAQRELKEELGIIAQLWTDLGVTDPFTANVVSPTRLFLAQQLSFGTPSPEGTELIRCRKVSLPQAVQWALDGTISHAPSALLLLKIANRIV